MMSTARSFWAELEESICPCKGSGWAIIEDNWDECPVHFSGQLHPDSRSLLLDDAKALAEAEKNAHLNWKIEQAKDKLQMCQAELRQAQYALHVLELEKVNKTPTIEFDTRSLPPGCYPTVHMKAVRPEELPVISGESEDA